MIEFQIMDEWSSTIDIVMARTEKEALQRLEEKLDTAALVFNIRQVNPDRPTMGEYYAHQFEDDYF